MATAPDRSLRDVVLQKHREATSVNEIARALGLSRSAVKKIIKAAAIPEVSSSAATESEAWPLSGIYSIYLAACLFLSGCWMELDRAGFAAQAALLGLSALISGPWRKDLPEAQLIPPIDDAPPGSWWSRMAIGVFIALPIVIYFAATFDQEFPLLGDHAYHMLAGREAVSFWRRHFAEVLCFSFALIGVLRRWPAGRWVPVSASAGLILWSYFGETSQYFANYPAGFYSLAFPLNWATQHLSIANPLNPNRLINVLSLPAYLFVLRPLLLRRWPDQSLLPFACFYFFQKDVVYYFTTTYLEPWSIILVLLALEATVRGDPRKPWLAVLFCGAASIFKHQSILLLPWIWAANYFEQLKNGRWKDGLIAGLVAGTPFTLYYLFRSALPLNRTVSLATLDQLSNPARIAEFGHRLFFQFGSGGLVLLGVIALATLAMLIGGPRRIRVFLACTVGGALAQAAFFYFDYESYAWTGYTRYHLQAYALLGAILLVIGHHLHRHISRNAALLVSAAILALNIPVLADSFTLVLQPDPARNFAEHYDSPIYYPIKALLRKAEAQNALLGVRKIRTLGGRGNWLSPKDQYPLLDAKYHMALEPLDAGAAYACRCDHADEGKLLVRDYFGGLQASNKFRNTGDLQTQRCLESFQSTCRWIFAENIESSITGILAIGVKTSPRSRGVAP